MRSSGSSATRTATGLFVRWMPYNPADPTPLQVVVLSLPWLFLTLGQAVTLASFSGLRGASLAAFMLPWLVAGYCDASVFGAQALGLMPGESPGALKYPGYVALYAALVAVVYGFPTGAVLASFAGRLGQGRRPG